METPRIRTSQHPDEPTPPNVFSDFAWVRENRRELLKKHGEGVVLVYEQQIIGMGNTIEEAEQDAERRLSPEVAEVTPIIYFLYWRHPAFRVRPKGITLNEDNAL
jgi:hypothetical protein